MASVRFFSILTPVDIKTTRWLNGVVFKSKCHITFCRFCSDLQDETGHTWFLHFIVPPFVFLYFPSATSDIIFTTSLSLSLSALFLCCCISALSVFFFLYLDLRCLISVWSKQWAYCCASEWDPQAAGHYVFMCASGHRKSSVSRGEGREFSYTFTHTHVQYR